MKRKIIKIDEDKCDGCGLCIPNCPEGALQIVDGKARMVSEFSCDGLGACLGHCPKGAITIEEREAEAYDEKKVMVNIVKAGADTIKAHLLHLHEHGEEEYLAQAIDYLNEHDIPVPEYIPVKKSFCGCPSMKTIDRTKEVEIQDDCQTADVPSQLRQWPVQMKLLNPHAPYFNNADLLLAADCVAFAYGDFHKKFLKRKSVIIFCPKLDNSAEEYIEKLATILKDNTIKSVAVTRMEVPCCGGVTAILTEAIKRSGKKIDFTEYTITLDGNIK